MSVPAVAAEHLTKVYGDTCALADLNLEVPAGEVLGYLGPNGAGKTTTIRLMLGFAKPTSGKVSLFGLDSQAQAADAHKHLAFVPGEPSLWPALTGAETLHLLAQVHGSVDLAYRDELIERFGLDPSKKVRSYSRGNRQKILLIAAFAARADLLVLDEPTSGLDPLNELTFRNCVKEAKERGQTVFLSSHILSEVEAVCDRVAIIRAGRLVEIGTLNELRVSGVTSLELEFKSAVPDLSRVPGVTVMETDAGTVRLHLRGAVGPLLKVIAKSEVTRFLSREPSLEEVFLVYYADRQDDPTFDHVG